MQQFYGTLLGLLPYWFLRSWHCESQTFQVCECLISPASLSSLVKLGRDEILNNNQGGALSLLTKTQTLKLSSISSVKCKIKKSMQRRDIRFATQCILKEYHSKIRVNSLFLKLFSILRMKLWVQNSEYLIIYSIIYHIPNHICLIILTRKHQVTCLVIKSNVNMRDICIKIMLLSFITQKTIRSECWLCNQHALSPNIQKMSALPTRS